MAIAKFRIGDRIKVIAGRSKGQVGQILKIDGDQIYVHQVNLLVKCLKKRKDAEGNITPGSLKKVEAPMHRSNLALYDAGTESIVKVAIKEIDGKRVRVNRKTGEKIVTESKLTISEAK